MELIGTNQFPIETPTGKITTHNPNLKRYTGDATPRTLAQRIEHAKSLNHNPTQWVDAGTPAKDSLDTNTLVGRRIRVWWPSLKRNCDGLVTNRAGVHDGRHVILYFDEIECNSDPEF